MHIYLSMVITMKCNGKRRAYHFTMSVVKLHSFSKEENTTRCKMDNLLECKKILNSYRWKRAHINDMQLSFFFYTYMFGACVHLLPSQFPSHSLILSFFLSFEHLSSTWFFGGKPNTLRPLYKSDFFFCFVESRILLYYFRRHFHKYSLKLSKFRQTQLVLSQLFDILPFV